MVSDVLCSVLCVECVVSFVPCSVDVGCVVSVVPCSVDVLSVVSVVPCSVVVVCVSVEEVTRQGEGKAQ